MADKLLGGRYAVQDRIGIGGMATVYRGLESGARSHRRHQDDAAAVRIRSVLRCALQAGGSGCRGAPEPKYVVGVYDWGKDGYWHHIVMEYLRGTDLKTGIRNHGAPRLPQGRSDWLAGLLPGPL